MGGREHRLGIDIGRVLIDGPPRGANGELLGDTSFFDGDEAEMLATPEVPESVEVIARLVRRFDRRVWFVSKCGPRTQARTERWLAAHRIYERTGIPAGNVRYCLERADKRGHAAELGLTHFVDDHPEVHAALHGLVEHLYLFGPQWGEIPPYVEHAPTWRDVEKLVFRTLPDAP